MKKFERIYHDVKELIVTANVSEGEQLPADSWYMTEYSVSRPTVSRAMRQLEREGLVIRGPGMGTLVRAGANSATAKQLFGLAFPETGHGEIFDPIMKGIAAQGSAQGFSLMWGSTERVDGVFSGDEVLELMRDFADRGVDGVFFAPLEGGAEAPEVNMEAVGLLDDAGIPVVLIDRDLEPFPVRSRYPLVSIDNVRAGYLAAEHYLTQGVERVDFVWLPYSGYTIELRIRGYQLAMLDAGLTPRPEWIHYGDPEDAGFVTSLISGGGSNVICGNDETAARFMNTLRQAEVAVPAHVRVAAFDDVMYSRLISVPLTTIRQPVHAIARRAVREMLQARDDQSEVTRETILIPGDLVVRESSQITQQGSN